jgi:hypothetical protein
MLYYWVGTTVEESLEMAACILAIGAVINQITTRPDSLPPTAMSVRLDSPRPRHARLPRRARTGSRA